MNKKIPMRLCLGCNSPSPKRELIRVVRGADGSVSLDLTGKKPGRGAYICNNPACIDKLQKNKRLGRTFGVEIDEGIYDALREELASGR